MSETRKTFEGKLYYVTLTVVGWIDVFTRKEYVYELMDNIAWCQQHKGLNLYAYVIMSNHLHMIAEAQNGKLSILLGHFKSYTSKQLIDRIDNNQQESRRECLPAGAKPVRRQAGMMHMFRYFGKENPQNEIFQFWQNGNHSIELYKTDVIRQKLNYLHNNPVKQGIVARPEDYLYSSANEYSPIKVLEM